MLFKFMLENINLLIELIKIYLILCTSIGSRHIVMACEKTKTWVGSSISDLCNNKEVWSYNVSPILISKYHAVLFKLPVTMIEPPEPYKNSDLHHWDNDHVRMPFSDQNLFPVTENGIDVIKLRWKLIKENLHRPINDSRQLEAAIHSYNSHLPQFTSLHDYFDNISDEENEDFFKKLLPKIISLALNLPKILPGSLPLLKQNHNRSVSLSQYQVSSLLANAFLCTFPWRKDTASKYPGANFITLFSAEKRPKRQNSIFEKFKCIFHYFKMVTSSVPLGVITFQRKYVHRTDMPRWDTCDNNFGDTKVHIDSSGTIEEGFGFLQVDFANKNVGGGVLKYGCVQEEIRFVICPELIIARLFVEQLTDFDAIVVTGVQRYSKYSGYSDTFTWEGAFNDHTPRDQYGRIRTSVCIIDATHYNRISQQFYPSAMLREVNKAYVGFSMRDKRNLAPVATGNWGCGAFGGSLYLKSLLQLMACSMTGRHLVYYTFGNEEFKNDFHEIFTFLSSNNVKVLQLWRFLCSFCSSGKSENKLFAHIKQAYIDIKTQPSINSFYRKEEAGPSTHIEPKEACVKNKNNYMTEQELDKMLNGDGLEGFFDEDMNVDECCSKKIKTNNAPKLSQEQIKEKLPTVNVGKLNDEMEGYTSYKPKEDGNESLLEALDRLSKKKNTVNNSEKMDFESVPTSLDLSVDSKVKRKISDYFSKVT